jgi:hypothetical protein
VMAPVSPAAKGALYSHMWGWLVAWGGAQGLWTHMAPVGPYGPYDMGCKQRWTFMVYSLWSRRVYIGHIWGFTAAVPPCIGGRHVLNKGPTPLQPTGPAGTTTEQLGGGPNTHMCTPILPIKCGLQAGWHLAACK